MKKLIYILSFILFSCGLENHSNDKKVTFDSIISTPIDTISKKRIVALVDTNIQTVRKRIEDNKTYISRKYKLIEIDSISSIQLIMQFSEDFTPSESFATLPEITDTIYRAFEIAKSVNYNAYEECITLIFIKLYRAHLECCHQSYEVRKQRPDKLNKLRDPLVYEFLNFSKGYQEGKRLEFISSSIGYTYVKQNPHLLENNQIKEQYDIIKKISKNIEDGVYWKE
jgi:acyl carrier protein